MFLKLSRNSLCCTLTLIDELFPLLVYSCRCVVGVMGVLVVVIFELLVITEQYKGFIEFVSEISVVNTSSLNALLIVLT